MALKKLNHTETVRDYVKEFTSLLPNIKDMSEEEKLFNSLIDLQNWAQIKVRQQGAKDLMSAIVTVEALVDLQLFTVQETDKS